MNSIKDIITTIRKCADDNERVGFHDLRCVSTDTLRAWADFLEQAVRNCNQLIAREALGKINRVVWDKCRHTKEETEAHRLATEALTQPPRNCDAYTKSQILEILDRRSFSKEDTIEWLYGTKGVEV